MKTTLIITDREHKMWLIPCLSSTLEEKLIVNASKTLGNILKKALLKKIL
jgi:hypothetical protein